MCRWVLPVAGNLLVHTYIQQWLRTDDDPCVGARLVKLTDPRSFSGLEVAQPKFDKSTARGVVWKKITMVTAMCFT